MRQSVCSVAREAKGWDRNSVVTCTTLSTCAITVSISASSMRNPRIFTWRSGGKGQKRAQKNG
eukprot:7267225-Pyramimonas_sp.AAC.1